MDEPELPAHTPKPTVSPRWVLPAATGAAGLVLGVVLGAVIGFGVFSANTAADEAQARDDAAQARSALAAVFPEAVRTCDADEDFAVVSDGGLTLTIDGHGKDDFTYDPFEATGLDATPMWCIVDALKAPTAVISHMEQTTSLDGRQTEAWDNIEVSWSYHPDRGMDSVWQIAAE